MHLHPAPAFRRPAPPLPSEAPEPADVDRVEYADHVVWHLPASPKAATLARHLVLACLSRWQCAADAVDTVALLVTELVTNAVQHGAAPILLRLDREGDHRDGDAALTIAVHDAGTLPVRHPEQVVPPSAEHGRGLRLVEALADAFALSSGGRGTLAVARLGGPGEEGVRLPGVVTLT